MLKCSLFIPFTTNEFALVIISPYRLVSLFSKNIALDNDVSSNHIDGNSFILNVHTAEQDYIIHTHLIEE
jgi:hypothetical protein